MLDQPPRGRLEFVCARIAVTRIGWGANPRGMGAESDGPDNLQRGRVMQEAARSFEYNPTNERALLGSPESVIRRLEEGRRQIGCTLSCGNHGIGRPPELGEQSIRFFSRHIVPAFAGGAA